MLLFIFGAGASFDSWADRKTSDKTGRIPLSDDLFDVGYARFVTKHLRPIVPLLRTRPEGVSLEQRLEELHGEQGAYPERVRQLMAVRVYLQQMLSPIEEAWVKETGAVSNYRTLLDELQLLAPKEPIFFVTFNYDTLLERAIESDTPRRFPDVDSYVIADERLNVYKLHGSLNWWRLATAEDKPAPRLRLQSDALIDLAPSLAMLDEWVKGRAPTGRLAAPAVAVPLVAKQDYECPRAHIDHLREALKEVDTIVSIGWRATDQPFLDLLRDNAKSVRSLVAVAGRNPDEPLNRIAAAVPTATSQTTYRGGFSPFIVNRELKRLLGGARGA
jgi:hypothetical protein